MKIKLSYFDFIKRYHSYSWLLNIPFVIYFGITMMDIGRMKLETKQIEKIISERYEEKSQILTKEYPKFEKYAKIVKSRKDIYYAMEEPFQTVTSVALLESEEFIKLIDNLDQDLQEIINVNESILDYTSYELRNAEEYPALKKHLIGKLMIQILGLLQNRMDPDNGFYINSKFFNPVIVQMEDKYKLYPSDLDEIDFRYQSLSINGDMLDEFTYTFSPKETGLHTLNIEYSFDFMGCFRSLHCQKRLFVE